MDVLSGTTFAPAVGLIFAMNEYVPDPRLVKGKSDELVLPARYIFPAPSRLICGTCTSVFEYELSLLEPPRYVEKVAPLPSAVRFTMKASSFPPNWFWIALTVGRSEALV